MIGGRDLGHTVGDCGRGKSPATVEPVRLLGSNVDRISIDAPGDATSVQVGFPGSVTFGWILHGSRQSARAFRLHEGGSS